jgi:hypothetical protein
MPYPINLLNYFFLIKNKGERKIMKIKILSLVLIAIVAINAIGITNAANEHVNFTESDKALGLVLYGGDLAAIDGRQATVRAYDDHGTLINNVVQEKFRHTYAEAIIFPAGTAYVDVLVETWEVEGLGWNGHWDTALTHRFSKNQLTGYLKQQSGLYRNFYNAKFPEIITDGTAWSAYAMIHRAYEPNGDVINANYGNLHYY